MRSHFFLAVAAIHLSSTSAIAQVPVLGTLPKAVTISGEDGGLVKDGSAWSSTSLKDKVHMLVYVDPDMKDLNDELTKQLKAKAFDHQAFKSVAIINMKATWKPNAIISAMLNSKQKEYPDTIYVKDYTGVLVREWALADDNFDVILFNAKGDTLFRKDGQLTQAEISEFIKLVETEIAANKSATPATRSL